MKTIIKESFKKLIADRYLLALIVLMMVISITLAVIIGFSIHSSELQLISHYSAFGITHLYRDQWFYLFVFVFFELIVAGLHTVISVKLLITKGHSLAIAYAWFGNIILIMGWITAFAVLNVWAPK